MKSFVFSGCVLLLLFSAVYLSAQADPDSTQLRFSGFIKADYVFDSRQVVDSREGLFLFYPEDNSDPAHDQPSYNQYAFVSRLRAEITGPQILNAASSAVIEGDFSGASNAGVDEFRLRHAYFKLKWKNTTALSGQYWHPLTVPEAFPRTLSLNIGAPFHAFNRGPQARIEHRSGIFKFIAAVVTQRDFSFNGLSGYSPVYMYKGGLPDFHAQLHVSQGKWTLGAGAGYKAIAPAYASTGSNERLGALSAVAFAKYESARSGFVLQSVYGENLYDHLMLGGYLLHDYDSLENAFKMTNNPTATAWADYSHKFKNGWVAGVFAGFAMNYYTDDSTDALQFTRGYGIGHLYRISPRLMKNIKNLLLGFEPEYTAALYNGDGKQDDMAENLRLSLILIYRF